ncbi:hypothetical protein WDU94_001609 [Cyamophila willieti]
MDYIEEQYVNLDYVPNNSSEVSEVIFKTQQQFLETKNSPDDEEEYRILDISTRQEPYVYPEETSEFQDESQADAEHVDSDDGDDEDRGVLKHAWQDEDPNNGSDNEQDPDPGLKAAASNIVKFINFLNKLQEDHYTFVNSDVKNIQMFEEQKQAVVINAHMITDLVKINFDNNNTQVNEIVNELKKVLQIKVDLFDKLPDKQVNGVVSHDVLKRLFSGNYLLIKAQIDELRGILFKKLENVHKILAVKQRELQKLKQASRKTPLHRVQVFTRPTPPKINSVERKIRDAKRKNNNLHTMTQEINSSLQNIQDKKCKIKAHMDRLNENDLPAYKKKKNNELHTIQQEINSSLLSIQNKKRKIKEHIDNLLEDALPEYGKKTNNELHSMEQEISSSLQNIQEKKRQIRAHIESLLEDAMPCLTGIQNEYVAPNHYENDDEDIEDCVIKSMSERRCGGNTSTVDDNVEYSQIHNSLKRKSPTFKQESSLEDFYSFTRAMSHKLKLKPDQASPSLILSKFRNNLNKKLNSVKTEMTEDQDENQAYVQLDLEDYREEEALVEEVFFEDVHSDDIESRVIKSLSGAWSGGNTGTVDDNAEYRETNDDYADAALLLLKRTMMGRTLFKILQTTNPILRRMK